MIAAPPSGRTDSRAGGRGVEVYDAAGQFLRRVPHKSAAEVIAQGLGVADGSAVRLRAGIRWVPSRDEKQAAGQPDLENLAKHEPQRYAANWRGSNAPEAGRGKGALGRRVVNRTVHVPPAA